MMGEAISDPEGMENGGTMKGMGLLPVITQLRNEKMRRQVHGTVNKMDGFFAGLSGLEFDGYEIHIGESVGCTSKDIPPLDGMPRRTSHTGEAVFVTGSNKNVCGTYIHGIFDKAAAASALVRALAEKKGIMLGGRDAMNNELCMDYKDFKEKQYDKLADTLSEYLNMEDIYGILNDAHIG